VTLRIVSAIGATALALVPGLLVGIIDANIKGRIVAEKYDNLWSDVPRFWHDLSAVSYSKVILLPVFLIIAYLLARLLRNPWLMVQSCIFAAFGAESLFFWWALPLFGIPHMHLFEGQWRVVGLFEYPDKAPWLAPLLPLKLLAWALGTGITRQVVYVGLSMALLINVAISWAYGAVSRIRVPSGKARTSIPK